MKTRNVIAAIAITAATTFAGVASANSSTGSLPLDVQTAAGAGQVTVTVDDGVATLFGTVETLSDQNAVETAALNFPGISEVRSSLIVHN